MNYKSRLLATALAAGLALASDGCERKEQPYQSPASPSYPVPTKNDQIITGCVPEVLPDGRRIYKQWVLKEDGQSVKLEPLPDVVVPGPDMK